MTATGGTEVVLVHAPDLMDRSRIAAAAPGARFFGVPDALVAAAKEASQQGAAVLALVDLARPGALAAVSALAASGAAVVGFGSHVDDELLASGRAAGAGEVLPRSVFFRRLGAIVASGQPGEA